MPDPVPTDPKKEKLDDLCKKYEALATTQDLPKAINGLNKQYGEIGALQYRQKIAEAKIVAKTPKLYYSILARISEDIETNYIKPGLGLIKLDGQNIPDNELLKKAKKEGDKEFKERYEKASEEED